MMVNAKIAYCILELATLFVAEPIQWYPDISSGVEMRIWKESGG